MRSFALRVLLALCLLGCLMFLGACNLYFDVDSVEFAQDSDDVFDGDVDCEEESNAVLCAAYDESACGVITVTDVCENERSISCGVCAEGFGCSEDNLCVRCEVDCTDRCGFVPDGCGGFVNCSDEPEGTTCDAGSSCQGFVCVEGECDPETECSAEGCGDVVDGCGGILTCGDSCPAGTRCQANACVCAPESDEELCEDASAQCGTLNVTDRCGNSRSADCGQCSGDESCSSNQCLGPCAFVDMETNPEHCGSCNNACLGSEVCVDGNCDVFVCQESQGTVQGSCEPFPQSGCNFDAQYCTLQLAVSGSPPQPRFITTCRDKSQAGSGTEGQSCTQPSDCAEELFCVGWAAPDARGRVCSRLCRRDTHEGCAPHEFCTNPFYFPDPQGDQAELEGLGFCTARCDVSDGSACPSNQRCTADPAFSSDTCNPNFRCLINGGSSGKSAGSSCDRTALHSDGCPPGFACFPAGSNDADVCVRRCQSDSDCSGGASCVNGQEPWPAMRYCSLN